MFKYHIYAHLLDNKVFYIGSGTKERAYRKSDRNDLYMNYIADRKDEVVVRIIYSSNDRDKCYKAEKRITDYFRNHGCILMNIVSGRNTGEICSGENNYFYNKHYYGEDNPFYGKNHSEETKKKMSEAKKNSYIGEGNSFFNKNHSAETKQKLREANIGKKYSDEVNSKKASFGKNNGSAKETTILFNGRKMTFDTFKQAMDFTNLSRYKLKQIMLK